jgi:hypothetical protein
LATTVRIQVHT